MHDMGAVGLWLYSVLYCIQQNFQRGKFFAAIFASFPVNTLMQYQCMHACPSIQTKRPQLAKGSNLVNVEAFPLQNLLHAVIKAYTAASRIKYTS